MRISDWSSDVCSSDLGIAAIGLLGALEILELDIVEAALCILVAVEQAAEHGIAVESGQAAPHDARLGIDESAAGAVADNRQVERAHPRSPAPAPSLKACSQARPAPPSGRPRRAAVGPPASPTHH